MNTSTVWRTMGRWCGVVWALPISILAFAVVVVLYPLGARWALLRYERTHAVVAWGAPLAWVLARMPLGRVAGITLGHVVWLRDRWPVRGIGAHEFVHVRQYAWLGVLFPVAYGLESAWQLLCGRHYYWDNRFEVVAYRKGRERFVRGRSGRYG